MSHIIEEYSKNLGVKISKPMLSKHFWPIMHDKYITIYLDPHTPSKQYKYYNIVVDMVKNILSTFDIKIIQVGSSKTQKLTNIDECIFDLNFKNFAYILSKSSLHVGIDNVFSHYASSINLPTVTLFGNVYSEISKGYWGKESINIEAPWEIKPCLNHFDNDDNINKIQPELIANSILKQLKINKTIPLKTKFIGNYYHNQVLELVPNFFSPLQDLKNQMIFIRTDYGFHEESFIQWCNYLNHFSIFSKNLLPISFLEQFRQKIKSISYIIDNNTIIPENYLNTIQSLGIQVNLLVENENDLAVIREKNFDFNVNHYFKNSKKELEDKVSDFNNLYFNSSKVIIANGGKQYVSKFHFQQGKNFIDKNFNLEDNDVLLEELGHFYIYERTK
jgi:hypothetical protein